MQMCSLDAQCCGAEELLPQFVTGSIPSGMQVCMVTHVEWRLHWNMHRTGLQCFSSKKTAFPLPSALPGVVWGRVSRRDALASLPISQGFFSPRSCPSHPARQESVASHVCCRGAETKPSLWGRAGCGSDAGCRDPRWPCLPPFPWLPGAACSQLCWQGCVGSSCPFMCEERENTDW